MKKLITIVAILLAIGCTKAVQDILPRPTDDNTVDKGRYLVQGLAACGYCHGDKRSPRSVLSGGQEREDVFGRVNVPNLTPDETGIKGWSAFDVVKVLRGSISPEGKHLSKDVHEGYEWMSDTDTYAITAYLGTLPPIKNEVERRELGFVTRNTTGFLESWREVKGHVPDIAKRYPIARGKYLVDNVARCGSCHNSPEGIFGASDYLAGGRIIKNDSGEKTAPAINNAISSGLGGWSKEDIAEYLMTGTNPSGETMDPNFCPWEFYQNSNKDDLFDIAEYLKTVG